MRVINKVADASFWLHRLRKKENKLNTSQSCSVCVSERSSLFIYDVEFHWHSSVAPEQQGVLMFRGFLKASFLTGGSCLWKSTCSVCWIALQEDTCWIQICKLSPQTVVVHNLILTEVLSTSVWLCKDTEEWDWRKRANGKCLSCPTCCHGYCKHMIWHRNQKLNTHHIHNSHICTFIPHSRGGWDDVA